MLKYLFSPKFTGWENMPEYKEVRVYVVGGEKEKVLITDEHNVVLPPNGLGLGDPKQEFSNRFVDDFFQKDREVQIFPIDPEWTSADAPTVVKEAHKLHPELYEKIRETNQAANLDYGDRCRQITKAAEEEIEEIRKRAEEEVQAIAKPEPLEKRVLKTARDEDI
jgi:hypothetical protein